MPSISKLLLGLYLLFIHTATAIHPNDLEFAKRDDLYAPPVASPAASAGASVSTNASAVPSKTGPTTPKPTGTIHPDDPLAELPSLGPGYDETMMESFSKLDNSLNSELSSVLSVASASLPCLTVTDVSGSPVTMCGPTQASAPAGATGQGAGGKLRANVAALLGVGLLVALMAL